MNSTPVEQTLDPLREAAMAPSKTIPPGTIEDAGIGARPISDIHRRATPP